MNLFGPRRSAWLSAPLAATLLLALLQPYSAGAAVMAGAAKRCPSHAGSVGHPPGRAPRIRSSLHACPDGTLRTATGRKIRIEGLDYLQSGWGNTFAGRCNGTATFPPRYAAADMARWGFNAVQLFVSWANLEPTPPGFDPVTKRLIHHYSRPYLRALSRAVARFHRHGVAVVLSMMQSRWSGAFQNIDAGDRVYPCGVGMPAWIYERTGQPAGGAAAKRSSTSLSACSRVGAIFWYASVPPLVAMAKNTLAKRSEGGCVA